MASVAKPGDRDTGGGGDVPDAGQRIEPADAGSIVEAAGRAVHESDDFPSGGGDGLPARPGGVAVEASERGSTGRGSTDAGKADGGGEAGGGMAGSAGG